MAVFAPYPEQRDPVIDLGGFPAAAHRTGRSAVAPNERGYDAIAGIHRLEAAKQLDWTMISCIVLHDIDADQWAR